MIYASTWQTASQEAVGLFALGSTSRQLRSIAVRFEYRSVKLRHGHGDTLRHDAKRWRVVLGSEELSGHVRRLVLNEPTPSEQADRQYSPRVATEVKMATMLVSGRDSIQSPSCPMRPSRRKMIITGPGDMGPLGWPHRHPDAALERRLQTRIAITPVTTLRYAPTSAHHQAARPQLQPSQPLLTSLPASRY